MVTLDTEHAAPTQPVRRVLCQALAANLQGMPQPCEHEAITCQLWAGTLAYLCLRHSVLGGYARLIPDLPEVPLADLSDDLLRQTEEKLGERYEDLIRRIEVEKGLAQAALLAGADCRELMRERGLR